MKNNPGMSGGTETAPGALEINGAQPVWMTLDEARERGFTGEIAFEVDPEVLAYFDGGVVYYAERVTDAPLARRLLDAGVLDAVQLDRGTVRVGDVEHLGRLFDREPSVDRDAVLVVTEASTEDLIADLANREVATVRVTAYRHHPSGVHRWFVARLDQQGAVRPLSDLAQLGSTAVDDLPPLTLFAGDDEELTIEWDEPFEAFGEPFEAFGEPFGALTDDVLIDESIVEDSMFDDFVVEVEMPVDEADADEADAVEMSLEMAEFVEVVEVADVVEVETAEQADEDDDEDDADTDFALVWPDGTEELTTADPFDAEPVPAEPVVSEPVSPFAAPTVRFDMPPLELSDDPDQPTDTVPDDVAAAVRRAIAAIEHVTAETPVVPMATVAPQAPAVAPMGAFAPPTMDMRAEVIYAKLEAEMAGAAYVETAVEEPSSDSPMVAAPSTVADTLDAPAMAGAPTLAGEPMMPTDGVASVVFVDDVPTGGDNERTSALKRLIGSLRRKDR